MFKKHPFKGLDLNKEARAGRYYCASCGKPMKKHHHTGHCAVCRRKGY